MTRHLVTGGAGFLGSALVRRLAAEGHDVTVLDRFSRGKSRRVPVGVHVITADVRNYEPVYWAVKNADTIWHLAYVQGTAAFYADPKNVIDVALHGIMNVLRACEVCRQRPRELFLVSSSEVYQDPPDGMFPTDESVPLSVPDVTNPRYSYGGGKIASEIATLAYAKAGLLKRAVIVRPHNVYGPDMGGDHVIPQFARRMRVAIDTGKQLFTGDYLFPIQGTGQETRSFCYIDDAVDGLMVLLEKGEDRGVYHLGNPAEEWAIKDLAAMVANYYGVTIEISSQPLLEGSPKRRKPDIGKLAALGYAPRWTLAGGLDPTLDWYAQNWSAAEGISRTGAA